MEQDQFMTASHQKDLTHGVGQGFATNVSVSQAWPEGQGPRKLLWGGGHGRNQNGHEEIIEPQSRILDVVKSGDAKCYIYLYLRSTT